MDAHSHLLSPGLRRLRETKSSREYPFWSYLLRRSKSVQRGCVSAVAVSIAVLLIVCSWHAFRCGVPTDAFQAFFSTLRLLRVFVLPGLKHLAREFELLSRLVALVAVKRLLVTQFDSWTRFIGIIIVYL